MIRLGRPLHTIHPSFTGILIPYCWYDMAVNVNPSSQPERHTRTCVFSDCTRRWLRPPIWKAEPELSPQSLNPLVDNSLSLSQAVSDIAAAQRRRTHFKFTTIIQPLLISP